MGDIARRWSQDAGSTATEYALIASLIAIVALIGIILLGDSVSALFDDSASSISDATGT